MNLFYLLAVVQITLKNVYSFKPNYAVQKESKSIFSDKMNTETIAPARYNTGNHIKYDNSATENFMPEHYFPDVEYPINILEASKPFYAITGDNAMLKPFSDDIITSFNSALVKPVKNNGNSENKNKNSLNLKPLPGKDISNIGMISKTIALEDNFKETEVITNNNEGLEKPAKLILPEINSQEYYYEYEYMDYDGDFPTKGTNDDVEVFFINEFLNTAPFEDGVLENASISEVDTDNFNISQTSSVEVQPFNGCTSVESDTCAAEDRLRPVEEINTKLNDVTRKIHRRIELGPIQNIKQRKFLRHMNKMPIKV